MTDQNITDYVVPSDPETRRRIRQAVSEASDILTMIDGQRDTLKENKKHAKDELGVPTKIYNKMVRAFHKQKYSEIVADNEAFELFYGNIMEDPTTT